MLIYPNDMKKKLASKDNEDIANALKQAVVAKAVDFFSTVIVEKFDERLRKRAKENTFSKKIDLLVDRLLDKLLDIL
jgi:uncharacterized protein with ATP-grasp and redox domains